VHSRVDSRIIAKVFAVLSQHASASPFLWQLRSRAVAAPHFDLSDLSSIDERLDAHIDGLRIADEDGWQLCKKELPWEEPGEIFAAAVLALESGDQSKIQSVLKVVTNKPELTRGLISALGWLDYKQAEPYIKNLCASQLPAHKRIGIAAAAIHRKDPGRPLYNGVLDPDPLLRARAFRGTGELGRTDLVPHMQRELNGKEPSCRFWAAWSTALLVGYREALDTLLSIAESPSPYRELALHMALRRMDLRSAHIWQQALSQKPQTTRLGVIASGIIGDPALIPWLTQQMNTPPLARVAGEAFSMITGVDIAYEDLDADKPEGFEAGPTEDPKDNNVEMDPDERLPWPSASLIAEWWQKHGGEFQSGIRHLLGKPISMDSLEQALRIGRQRQRAAAALELAIMCPGSPLFEVRAPGFRQQEMLQLGATR